MSASKEANGEPIINLPPPSPAVRASVERYLLDFIARRVLVDLGLVAGADDECGVQYE